MSRKGPYQIVHDYEATARKECSQGAKRGHTTAHMLIIARRFTSVIRKDLEDGDVGRDEELGLKRTSALATWQIFRESATHLVLIASCTEISAGQKPGGALLTYHR